MNILKIAPTCGLLASFAVVMFYKHHGELNDNETCLQYSPWQHSAWMEQKWRFDKLLYNHAFMICNLLGSWPDEQLYNITLLVLKLQYSKRNILLPELLMSCNHAFMMYNLLGSWPSEQHHIINLVVLKLEYSRRTVSVPGLLMPWLLMWLGHWQLQHWISRMNGSLFSMGKDWSHL